MPRMIDFPETLIRAIRVIRGLILLRSFILSDAVSFRFPKKSSAAGPLRSGPSPTWSAATRRSFPLRGLTWRECPSRCFTSASRLPQSGNESQQSKASLLRPTGYEVQADDWGGGVRRRGIVRRFLGDRRFRLSTLNHRLSTPPSLRFLRSLRFIPPPVRRITRHHPPLPSLALGTSSLGISSLHLFTVVVPVTM